MEGEGLDVWMDVNMKDEKRRVEWKWKWKWSLLIVVYRVYQCRVYVLGTNILVRIERILDFGSLILAVSTRFDIIFH